MPSRTLFSHIVQKRFSHSSEDIATDALAYILDTSQAARDGFVKMLRAVAPELPELRFKTQQTEGSIRPDMWGFVENQPRVFVENKFWAGLTDNQPVSYLTQLAAYPQPTVLLVIAPAAREHTLWRELKHRLQAGGMMWRESQSGAILRASLITEAGPVLALASWSGVLSILEVECAHDAGARADIAQLRALCDSADEDAFAPVSRAELTDQRLPAFVLQLGNIVNAAVGRAVAEQIVSLGGTRPQASWNRIGRYAWLSREAGYGAGVWMGIDFGLWRTHGATPLWLTFSDGPFGRGQEVRPLIETWAARTGALITAGSGYVAVALNVPHGEEQDEVVRSLVADLMTISAVLDQLPPRPSPVSADE